jgi:hypothetical protein
MDDPLDLREFGSEPAYELPSQWDIEGYLPEFPNPYPPSIADLAGQVFTDLINRKAYAGSGKDVSDLRDLVIATKQLDLYLGRSFNRETDSHLFEKFTFDSRDAAFTPDTLRTWIGNFTVTLEHDVEHHIDLIISLANWVLLKQGVAIGKSRIPVAFPAVLHGLFALKPFAKDGYTYIGYGGIEHVPGKTVVRADAYSITLQDSKRVISAYTHFKLNQAGRWANGFPWDASTDANQRRSFFNNAVFDDTDGARGTFEDIYLRPVINIDAGDEIYAQYGPGYSWESIYTPRTLMAIRPEDNPVHDWVPLRERKNPIQDYALNARVINRMDPEPQSWDVSPPSSPPGQRPREPSPQPSPQRPMAPMDLDQLFAAAALEIPLGGLGQEYGRWDPGVKDVFKEARLQYGQWRKMVSPELAEAVANYTVRAVDLNDNARFAMLVVLANLIPGPFLSYNTCSLFADKRYTSKSEPMSVCNEYFPEYLDVRPWPRRRFAMSVAGRYAVPPNPPIKKRVPPRSFRLGEKGIWIKEYVSNAKTQADRKEERAKFANVDVVVGRFGGEELENQYIMCKPQKTVIIQEGDELFKNFQDSDRVWSRLDSDAAAAAPKQRRLQSCIACSVPATEECVGCKTAFCSLGCRVTHWDAIGCPCKTV